MDEPTKPTRTAASARANSTVASKAASSKTVASKTVTAKNATTPRAKSSAQRKPATTSTGKKPGAASRTSAPTTTAPETAPTAADNTAVAEVEPIQNSVEAPPAPVDDTTTAVPTITGVMKRPELPETQWQGGELASNTPPPLPDAPLAVLQANSISAWFGDRKVLDRVDLTMEAGKVTALIGPSGCGKSTFLRILNRMHEMIPSASLAGEVLLDGVDIYDANRRLTQARRDIGMVFQKPNPFPAMSIYDNVIAGLKLTGISASRDTKDQLVESSLTKAGLWKEVRDRLRQPGGGLSGGQQQRLCIARSLAVRPRVLLMDEPCSALDPTSTRVIEETMLELAKEVTIVIVTHNMQQAQRVSDNCAFFLASLGTPGAIVEQGDTAVMFSDPTDPRTLDYVNGRFG